MRFKQVVKKAIELHNFVRPRTESGTWRVIEIDTKGRVTAAKHPEYDKKVKADQDFFTSLEDETL